MCDPGSQTWRSSRAPPPTARPLTAPRRVCAQARDRGGWAPRQRVNCSRGVAQCTLREGAGYVNFAKTARTCCACPVLAGGGAGMPPYRLSAAGAALVTVPPHYPNGGHGALLSRGTIHRLGLPVGVLGGGSNLIISDDGFDGLVVEMAQQGIEEREEDGRALVTAQAGEDWDLFVERCVAAGLQGLECLSGIPGRVGATPIQNVGAYGQEVSETIAQVRSQSLSVA